MKSYVILECEKKETRKIPNLKKLRCAATENLSLKKKHLENKNT